MQKRDIYTHRPCPSASDYGVSKHVAGAIVHEPVPYSTSLRTQAHPSSKRSEYIRQAAAYDECQTKPRLDPPVQFLSPSCLSTFVPRCHSA